MGTVTRFKYLGAVVSGDGLKPEVLLRVEQATAALTKLKPIWRDNNISFGSKVKLMRSLVISIFLYACESWTLVYKFRNIIGKNDFPYHFKKIIVRYIKKIGYNMDVLRQTACLVVNPIKVNSFAYLFNCTTVGRASD